MGEGETVGVGGSVEAVVAAVQVALGAAVLLAAASPGKTPSGVVAPPLHTLHDSAVCPANAVRLASAADACASGVGWGKLAAQAS
jgi:hypothetical protein